MGLEQVTITKNSDKMNGQDSRESNTEGSDKRKTNPCYRITDHLRPNNKLEPFLGPFVKTVSKKKSAWKKDQD